MCIKKDAAPEILRGLFYYLLLPLTFSNYICYSSEHLRPRAFDTRMISEL